MIPVLEYMKSNGDLDLLLAESETWRLTAAVLDATGLTIGLGALLSLSFGAIVLRQVFMYARLIYSNRIQAELVCSTSNKLFESYLFSSLAEQDKLMSGDAINDMTIELQRAIGALRSAIEFLALMTIITAYVLIVFAMSFVLSLASGAILVVVGVGLLYLTRRVEILGRAITTVNQNISSFLVERLNAVRLVRLSGIERAEIDRFGKFTRHQRDTVIDLQRLKALFSVSIEPLALSFAFVLLYVTTEGQLLSFEQIILFFFILLRLVPVAREAMVQRQSYISLLGSIDAVSNRLMSLIAAREPVGGEEKLKTLKTGIAFRNVSFRYPTRPDAPVLDSVSLEIRPGQMTAIVGPSGAGKSTLVDLLPCLRSPDSGVIVFDGIEQSAYSTASLRKAMAYVPQRAQILNMTVAEHIALGRMSADHRDIVAAAKLAGADSFIAGLPEGYATRLGEGGGRLSGGQRQRLDLARAIIREAPILILDEPTASLDAESETAFKEALARIRRLTKKTIIIIGHRFSTISDADHIIVLEGGQVSDSGTHNQLMLHRGWYAKAYAAQRLLPNDAEATDATNTGQGQPAHVPGS